MRSSSPFAKILQMNWVIVTCVMTLGVIGIMMQYSAAGGALDPWAKPHIVKFMTGMVFFTIMAIVPLSFYVRFAYPIYFLCVGMLIFVEVAGFVGMGAQRWINLGIFVIQPSELMKLALIIALARYFHFTHINALGYLPMLLPPLLLIAVPVLLILKQPNLGTATITSFIAVAIAFMAGVRWYYFAGMIGSALAAAPIGWHFLHDYQKQRVMTFLDPAQDPLGAGYNIIQSMIAIGSGGFWGKGFLRGSQGQLDFLPEKQTDFIFTMLTEELGFAGGMLVIILFAGLLIYATALSTRPRERFAGLVSTGVAAMLFAHIFINMAMVMGMIPVVGVPLPFLSYGGTFMFSTMMACGLLMNVYIHRDTTLHRNIRPFF